MHSEKPSTRHLPSGFGDEPEERRRRDLGWIIFVRSEPASPCVPQWPVRLYVTNRNAGTVEFEGEKVSDGGENNVAVFAIDQQTGEPKLIQNINGQDIQLRTFAIDPSARMLVAARIMPLPVREGNNVGTLTAGLSVLRVRSDGKPEFVHKYDVEIGDKTQV
jgi:Lactonase, 7-bladed beta-propeller